MEGEATVIVTREMSVLPLGEAGIDILGSVSPVSPPLPALVLTDADAIRCAVSPLSVDVLALVLALAVVSLVSLVLLESELEFQQQSNALQKLWRPDGSCFGSSSFGVGSIVIDGCVAGFSISFFSSFVTAGFVRACVRDNKGSPSCAS